MATAFGEMHKLTETERATALAVSVLCDRMSRLSQEDAEDLFQLFKCIVTAETDEDRVAAQQAFWEVLCQDDVNVREVDLSEQHDDGCEEFSKWKSFIGERIKRLRQDAGWTQDDLAEKTGLPQSHLSRIETGRLSPSHLTLVKIATALGIDAGRLDPNS